MRYTRAKGERMALGLPQRLAPAAVVRSITRGFSAAALTHVVATGIALVFLHASLPQLVMWPAFLAVAVLAALMLLHLRRRTAANLTVLMLGGLACVYAIAVTIHSQPDAVGHIDGYIVAMPTLALMLAPRVAPNAAPPLIASLGALVGGCVLVAASALQHGVVLVPAVTPVGTFALIALVAMTAARREAFQGTPRQNLQLAQRDEQVASLRYSIELKAAGLMHDTVLNDLDALAMGRPGPLTGAHRAQLDRDLTLLLGEEWLSEEPESGHGDPRAEWQRGRLAAAIDAARSDGLQVDVSGDLTVLARLTRESARALGLAVRQCLANVKEHSGTDRAEVAVYGSAAEVTVMVVDAGRGFLESDTAADRMGLRHSVRTRVEQAGGSVRLWSTPGRGTSVLIRVPAALPDTEPGRQTGRRWKVSTS